MARVRSDGRRGANPEGVGVVKSLSEITTHFGERAMDWIWNCLDYFVTFALGIAGVLLAVFPPEKSKGSHKAIWIAFMAALTLIGVAVKAKQDDSLETKISGGEHFCMIQLRQSAEAGKFIPQLHNATGLVPGVTFAFYRIEGGRPTEFAGWSGWGPCLKTTVDQRFELPEGQYRIDFVATNGTWRQNLRLWKKADTWMETTSVVHENRGVIYPEKTTQLTDK